MKKNIAVFTIAGLAAATLGVSPAFADDSSPSVVAKLPGSTMAGATCGARAKFNLTTEQLEKLNTLKTALKEETGPKKLELSSLRRDLMDKLTKGDADKSELLAIQGKINALKADLANSKISFMADASDIFTAEQKEQMRRRYLMRSMHGGKRHHGGGKFHHKRGFKGMQGKRFSKEFKKDGGATEKAAETQVDATNS